MKTQTKQLIALAAVLVVALAVYGGLRAWNNAKEAEETVADETLPLVELSDLTQLSYTTDSGETLTFTKDGKTWVSGEEPELPLVQAAISGMETALRGLEYQRVMEEHDELSGYGLDPAGRTVTGTDADGNTCTILLGDQIDYDGIYYAMVDGQDVVYVVSGDLLDAISYDLMDLAEVETLPEMTEETVKSISLMTSEGELILNKETEKKQEIQEQETGEADENGEAILEEVIVTTEIYHWFLADGTEIPDGNETLTAVLDELSSLSFSSVHAFRPTAEEVETLGLAHTAAVLSVECTDGTQMNLTLGAPDESGESCYASLDSSDRIYLMDVSGIDSLLAMTVETLTAESEE